MATQTSTSLPDEKLLEFRDYALTEAQKLYEKDAPNYYGGKTYIDPSKQTSDAFMAAQNRAMAGNPLLPAAQENVMNLQTATNQANPMFKSIFNNAQNAADPYNTRTASGAFLGSNPYFNAALRGGAEAASTNYFDAINRANTGASMAGRYGSRAQENLFNRAGTTLANSLANQAGELLSSNYNTERGLQEAAVGRIGVTSDQDTKNRLAAASGLSTASSQDLSRQLQAGIAAPELAAADYYDIDKLLKVGQGMEGYQRDALQADIERFNFEENKPYAKLKTFIDNINQSPTGTVSNVQQSGGSSKIVCTAMNSAYGFGSFRQAIWLQHSANMKNSKTIEAGYHALFLPVVAYAFNEKRNALKDVVRVVAEHIARHRTADLWKEMRGKKRDTLGRIYRAIIEPICYLVGKAKGA